MNNRPSGRTRHISAAIPPRSAVDPDDVATSVQASTTAVNSGVSRPPLVQARNARFDRVLNSTAASTPSRYGARRSDNGSPPTIAQTTASAANEKPSDNAGAASGG